VTTSHEPNPIILGPAGVGPPDVVPSIDPAVASERSQARRENWRLIRRRPSFIIGSLIVLFWTACAIFGEGITRYPIDADDWPSLEPPSSSNWFGTDYLGRDIMSRVMHGAREVFLVAPPAALLGVIGGVILGLIMGYKGGLTDSVLSRIVEAFLAMPTILIALLAITALGSGKTVVIGTVAVLFIPIVARTVRAAVLAERNLDYVTSARLRGENTVFIVGREILPNVMGPIIVETTVRIGYAIFTVAGLAFLGAGPEQGSTDWGAQVSEARPFLNAGTWWPTIFPALAIASLVVAVNLIADAVQSVLEA